jgi:hypothetical protein
MKLPARLSVAQVLLVGPLGALVVVAALAFSVFSGDSLSTIDWTVSAWAVASGALNLTAGLRMRRSTGLAQIAALNYLAFSLAKLIGYHEGASVPFIVLGVAVLILSRGDRITAPWARSSDTRSGSATTNATPRDTSSTPTTSPISIWR